MKFSESEKYLTYKRLEFYENFSSALEVLEEFWNIHESELDNSQKSRILASLGKLYFKGGDEDRALEMFRRADMVDPGSLISKYVWAKFLGFEMKRLPEAMAECDAIIATAQAWPNANPPDDLSSARYVEMAEELKASLREGRDYV